MRLQAEAELVKVIMGLSTDLNILAERGHLSDLQPPVSKAVDDFLDSIANVLDEISRQQYLEKARMRNALLTKE